MHTAHVATSHARPAGTRRYAGFGNLETREQWHLPSSIGKSMEPQPHPHLLCSGNVSIKVAVQKRGRKLDSWAVLASVRKCRRTKALRFLCC